MDSRSHRILPLQQRSRAVAQNRGRSRIAARRPATRRIHRQLRAGGPTDQLGRVGPQVHHARSARLLRPDGRQEGARRGGTSGRSSADANSGRQANRADRHLPGHVVVLDSGTDHAVVQPHAGRKVPRLRAVYRRSYGIGRRTATDSQGARRRSRVGTLPARRSVSGMVRLGERTESLRDDVVLRRTARTV